MAQQQPADVAALFQRLQGGSAAEQAEAADALLDALSSGPGSRDAVAAEIAAAAGMPALGRLFSRLSERLGAAPAVGAAPAAASLAAIPAEICCCIAEKLDYGDRGRLAATCRALRAASVDWFRSEVIELNTDFREEHALTAQHLAWLCRVQAPLSLFVGDDTLTPDILGQSGARIVQVDMSEDLRHHAHHECVRPLQYLPAAELAGLPHLRELTLNNNHIRGNWWGLPAQLRKLVLYDGCLKQLPPEFARLTQLTSLELGCNHIEGGWQILPDSLKELGLEVCDLRQVPELRPPDSAHVACAQ